MQNLRRVGYLLIVQALQLLQDYLGNLVDPGM